MPYVRIKAEELELIKAEQQLTGYFHRNKGYGLLSLLDAMNLTLPEFDQLVEKGMLNFLVEKEINDVRQILLIKDM